MTLRIGPRLSLPSRSTSAPTTTTDSEWRALRWVRQDFTISQFLFAETLSLANAARMAYNKNRDRELGKTGRSDVCASRLEDARNEKTARRVMITLATSASSQCLSDAAEIVWRNSSKSRDNSRLFRRATLIFSIVENISVEINGVIGARHVLMVFLPLCRVNN